MSSIAEKLLLDNTVSWFKSKGTPPSDKHDNKSSLLIKLVMGVAVLAFVAYLMYKSNKTAKELAKARHERDVALEDSIRDQKKWVLAKTNAEIEEAMVEVAESHTRAVELILEVDKIQEEHDYEKFKIEAIQNWDDMDRYLANIDTSSSS